MSTFQVGDVCEIVGGERPGWIGCEVTILGPLEPDPTKADVLSHRITRPSGAIGHARMYFASREHLRKKRPPLSSWHDVERDTLWNPEKVPVKRDQHEPVRVLLALDGKGEQP